MERNERNESNGTLLVAYRYYRYYSTSRSGGEFGVQSHSQYQEYYNSDGVLLQIASQLEFEAVVV